MSLLVVDEGVSIGTDFEKLEKLNTNENRECERLFRSKVRGL